MADDGPSRQLSLIPYTSDNREIVLQQGNAVVVYDSHSRQLRVRSAHDASLDLVNCPYCHRPLHDEAAQDGSRTPSDHHFGEQIPAMDRRTFVDPEYFSMLASSQQPSPVSSGFGTPARETNRLFLPKLRSGRSRDVSGSEPASGAEFLASEAAPSKAKGISSSAFSPGYFKQFFREERELGRGGNGVVLLVEHLLDGVSLGHFACKRIPVGNDHSWLEKVLIEVKLLAQVPHKNLVKYHWVWVEEHQAANFGPKVPCVWILQEYCNGGDLQNHVLGPKQATSSKERLKARHRKHSKGSHTPPEKPRRQSQLSLEEIFSFFRDITSGLHHLHSKGYIHRDVKPSNCLLHQDAGRTRVLLSDFGEVQAAGTRRGNTGATGTISYCAPEVLAQDSVNGRFGDFTTKSDVFSLGMILYFMCFGRLPYDNADDEEENEDLDLLRAEITAWQGFDHTGSRTRNDLPDRLYKFLQRLLSISPAERPNTEEILDSIRTTAGGGESSFFSHPSDETQRFTAEPQPNRRQSAYTVGRPRLSSTGRQDSGEHGNRHVSPSKHGLTARGEERINDESALSNIVLRPHKVSLLPDDHDETPQPSPRLMLPPPPIQPSRWDQFKAVLGGRSIILTARIALFSLKVLSLVVPCTPFAPKNWSLFPLLLLGLLDLLIEPFDVVRCMVFVMAHVLVVWTAYSQGSLCSGPRDFYAARI